MWVGVVGRVIDPLDRPERIGPRMPDGTVTEHARSELFNCPNGLARDGDGNLYALNFRGTQLLKVTPAGGRTVAGELVHLDDFNVALRDASGDYHSWTRTSSLKVEKDDPYDAHVALLDRYTDQNIHDVVAYLETLK